MTPLADNSALSDKFTFADGPTFDDLRIGDTSHPTIGMTITDGTASHHQAIVGDRLRLALDEELAMRVTGGPRIAHPALVWDVSIGQSTLFTQKVKANLFYRGLSFHLVPRIGDTLKTTTTVVGLHSNSPKPDRAPTGMALLRIDTVDQKDRLVLSYYRCAMLPRGSETARNEGARDVSPAYTRVNLEPYKRWRIGRSDIVAPRRLAGLAPGSVLDVRAGDVVTSAPELARLTLNVAAVHHDERAGGGRRLVYGGHTVGIVLSQATRALPDIATVLSWERCDHIAPVYEGDTVTSDHEIRSRQSQDGWLVTSIRSRGFAMRSGTSTEVLNWEWTALLPAPAK
ncbi:MaoC family dehydratase [Nocardia sp. CA-107356]|uniref:MaoC family dehydratase n=1 Tax=Nocardia sp. CA-107356 TaxID=3239972 RepID=UPI003D90B433